MIYSLNNSTSSDTGSVFPQVDCLSLPLAFEIDAFKFSNPESEILFKLVTKAKLTNVLSQASISGRGFLIDKKVKELLSDFQIMQSCFYKCLVWDLNGDVHEYFWLHLVDESLLTKIDYPKSKFYLKEYGFREDDLSFISYEDYKQADIGDMSHIDSDYLHLNKSFCELDLFAFPLLNNNKFISERLKDALVENNITGININSAAVGINY